MFVLQNFLLAFTGLIDFLFTLYIWIVVARSVISWVNADPYNPLVRFIYDVTEPPLRKLRSFIPLQFGNIDFAPLLLIVGVMFVQSFLVPTLRQFAQLL